MANQAQKFFGGFMLLLGVWIGAIVGIVLFADFAGGSRAAGGTDETLSSLTMLGQQIRPIERVVLLGDPDVAARTPRLEQETDILPDHVLNGYQGEAGYMPPKGGRLDLADEEMIAANEFILLAVQQ